MGDLDDLPFWPALTNLIGMNFNLFLGLILETKDCKEPDIRDKTESYLMVYLPPSKDTGQPDKICATVAGFLKQR